MTKEQILKFLVAGRAVFTLLSRKTGEHFTYRINKHPSTDCFFAAVKRGSDEWLYLGTYSPARAALNLTQHSGARADAPSVKGLRWFLRHIDSPRVEFKHEGRCGRCGRPLTHPDSIDSGLGPECSGRGYTRPTRPAQPPENVRSGGYMPPLSRKGPRAVTPPSVQQPLKGFADPRGVGFGSFGEDCCRALDLQDDQVATNPNLVVPMLLSLQPGGMK